MKRRRHDVLLILSAGMIVGAWAALRPAPADKAAARAAVLAREVEEPNLADGPQKEILLVEAAGRVAD